MGLVVVMCVYVRQASVWLNSTKVLLSRNLEYRVLLFSSLSLSLFLFCSYALLFFLLFQTCFQLIALNGPYIFALVLYPVLSSVRYYSREYYLPFLKKMRKTVYAIPQPQSVSLPPS